MTMMPLAKSTLIKMSSDFEKPGTGGSGLDSKGLSMS